MYLYFHTYTRIYIDIHTHRYRFSGVYKCRESFPVRSQQKGSDLSAPVGYLRNIVLARIGLPEPRSAPSPSGKALDGDRRPCWVLMALRGLIVAGQWLLCLVIISLIVTIPVSSGLFILNRFFRQITSSANVSLGAGASRVPGG